MALLVDLSCLCDHHTDAALEFIYKAEAGDPPDDTIWQPHQNVLIRHLIELFTKRGLDRIAGMDSEIRKWLGGEMHTAGEPMPRPPGAMGRWSRSELGLVKLYLETLPPDQFTLDDWMMLADYVVQRYLPADDLRTEAEWLVSRAALMGRVEASMTRTLTEREADRVLAALPPTVEAAAATIGLSVRERAVIEYGSARCCENVVALSDAARHAMKRIIMDYTQGQFLGDGTAAYGSLQTRLQDTFGAMNRDWRRIAVTEAGENLNQGFVASVPKGARLQRVEKYRGACAWCRSINGRVVTVVDASDPDKDGETQVWVGKTNVGRSASPRKREGGTLVEREPHEMWWISAGVQHPHCRGGWVHLQAPQREDEKFEAWLKELSGETRPAAAPEGVSGS